MLLGVAACGDDASPFGGLVRVSPASPFPGDCAGTGAHFSDAEVEPWLAVDPTDPDHLIGAWQQDRWANGGANGLVAADSRDGGRTWMTSAPPLSACAGGALARASDPWVAIGADGAAYFLGLAFHVGSQILVSRGTGTSWEAPVVLADDTDPDVLNDKPSLTADPVDPGRIYAVWDRVTGISHPTMPVGTGPVRFARTVAGSWEAARTIFDPGIDAQTIGNQIAVLPDGTLVDVFCRITMLSAAAPVAELAVIRSTDQGATWSAPIIAAPMRASGIAKDSVPVRTGDIIPELAVDRATGALRVVWEDGFGGALDGIAMVSSLDGGQTWSAPVQINLDHAHAAFDPMIAIAGGAIAVSYYDTRDDDPGQPGLQVAAWLASSPDGAAWTEARQTDAFAIPQLGDAYFLGDYQGLAASGDAIIPFFAVGTGDPDDPTDIYVRPVRTPLP